MLSLDGDKIEDEKVMESLEQFKGNLALVIPSPTYNPKWNNPFDNNLKEHEDNKMTQIPIKPIRFDIAVMGTNNDTIKSSELILDKERNKSIKGSYKSTQSKTSKEKH